MSCTTDETTRKRQRTEEETILHQSNNDTNNHTQNYPTHRRQSVSGESIRPSEDPNDRVVYPKSDELKKRLDCATLQNWLFKDIDRETKFDVIDAMYERIVKKNEQIFAQGDKDDIFYVIDHGMFHVIHNNRLYLELADGSSFGEHALMYNVARTATVVAKTDGNLWAISRETFQRTVSNHSHRKQSIYKNLLRSIPFLSSLNHEEISKLAEALEPMSFENGDTIISQGDLGDYFYIIKEGHVSVSKSEHGIEKQLAPLSNGNYFGEFTLFNNSPRNKTTVVAQGLVRALALKRDNFTRLLGPMMDIVRRNAAQYHSNTTTTDITNNSIQNSLMPLPDRQLIVTTTSSTSSSSPSPTATTPQNNIQLHSVNQILNNDNDEYNIIDENFTDVRRSSTTSSASTSTTTSTVNNNDAISSSPSSSSSSTRTRRSGYSGAGGVDVL
nr:12488_t:CDS:2 [Entrophospora candida]CAG8493199.1 8408_t:CDS:2 [Entrophospora candida]